jgi:outer membrane protein assembly factor BamB
LRLHAPAAGLHLAPRGPRRGLAHGPRVWPAAAALALLAGLDCARRLPPPVLFPARTLWLAPGDDVLEPPLAVDEVRVFAAGRGGTLRALDRGSGAVVWSQGGRPGVLTAGPGLLLLRQQDGSVLALDPASGETRWQANSGVAGTLPAALAEGLVVVAGAGAAALDAATGRTLWSAPLPPLAAPPVVAGGQVLLGGEDGTLHALDARSGAPLWTYATSAPLEAAPVVDERRRVLLGTGARRVVALRADERGSERWRFKVGGALGSPPALFEDAVLFAAYDAVLYAFRRGNGHLAWRAPLPSRPLSGPLLARGAVLVACHESEIVGYDARSGQRLGNLTTPAPMQTPPLLADDTLYVGLRDRSLVALRLAEATLEAPAASPSPSPGRRERRRQPGPRSPDSPPPPTPEPSSDP